MQLTDDVPVLNTVRASNPQGAIVDAHASSAQALAKYPQFFTPQHLLVVEEVRDLVDEFFTVRKGLYVNHRENRGKPFSVVKVDGCTYPVVSKRTKEAFLSRLAELKVQVTWSKATHSYLFRIQ